MKKLAKYLAVGSVLAASAVFGFCWGYNTDPVLPDVAAAQTVDLPREVEVAQVAEINPIELEMMALVIYQEAGGDACDDETRLMVGTVVMNRVADERFPDTIEDVLLQKGQYGRFYWTGLVWPERAGKEVEQHAVARAYECAERILQGERALPADVVWQSEHIQGYVVEERDGLYFCS